MNTLAQLQERASQITGSGKLTSIVATLNPALSKDMLAHNPNNRKASPSAVARYSRDMKEEAWVPFTGEPVTIDWNGNVVEGQHRLMACEKAGVSVPGQLFIFGVDPKVFKVSGGGRKRSFADVLGIKNIDAPHTIASAVSILSALERGQMSSISGSSETNDQRMDVFERHQEGLLLALKIGNRFPFDGAMWTVASYLATKHGLRLANMIEQVRTCQVKVGTPAYWLNAKVISTWRKKGDHIRSPRKLANVFAAFNSELTGKKSHLKDWIGLTDQDTGERDSFPALIGDRIYNSRKGA